MAAVIVLVALVVLVAVGVLFVAGRRGRGTILEPPPAPTPARPVEAAPEAPPAPVAEPDVVEPEVVEPEVVEPEAPRPKATFRDRLGRARSAMSGYVGSVLSRGKIDQETWDDLEEALIRADVGVGVTTDILERLRATVAEQGITEPVVLLEALKDQLKVDLRTGDRTLRFDAGAPNVWLFVGVNGVGKTTTIGKVGKQQADEGRRVLMAAGDTFRAAAAEQLETWATRSGAELVRGAEGGDPSSIIFDAVQRAAARGHDLVLADTAGRLHTKVNLMDELRKVRRVADRDPGQRHRGAPRARRHHRAERSGAGTAVHRGRGPHGRRAHEARRVGQGRHRPGHPVHARHPDQAGGARRDRGGPHRVRSRRLRRRAVRGGLTRGGPVMFTLIRLLFLPAKVGVGTTKLGVKAGYRAGRLLGARRVLVFGVGVGVGLLVAPVTGAEARDRLRRAIEARRPVGDQDLAERVRFELSHSPRTWHLPQPAVEVVGHVAVLRGQVPHETGRADLARAAGAVSGVTGVDNQVTVGNGAGTG